MMYFVLGTSILALAYMVLWAWGYALLFSPLIGATSVFFWRLVNPDLSGMPALFRVVGAAFAAPAVAAAIALPMNLPSIHLLGVLLSASTAFAVYSLRAQGRAVPCVLCRNPAPAGRGFDCPRCGDRICTRTVCWNSRYARCVRCHEREVVLLPIADTWWTAQLGPRVTKGECLSCYKDAAEVDLRECGQCHWPMCRRCWDYYNGSCQRCDWTMPNLPAALAPFITRRAKGRHGSGGRDRHTDRSSQAATGKRRNDDRTRVIRPPERPTR